MSTIINPYINFKGQARAAMELYHSVFGGKLDMNTYSEFQMDQDPEEADKIMHAMLVTENGITLMASDAPNSMPFQPGNTINISLSGENEQEIRGYWEKLADGGHVIMPLEKAPWNDIFGMVVDKFGIQWLVNINTSRA